MYLFGSADPLRSGHDVKFGIVGELYLPVRNPPHLTICGQEMRVGHFTLGPSKEYLNAVHEFRQDPRFGLHMHFWYRELSMMQ